MEKSVCVFDDCELENTMWLHKYAYYLFFPLAFLLLESQVTVIGVCFYFSLPLACFVPHTCHTSKMMLKNDATLRKTYAKIILSEYF